MTPRSTPKTPYEIRLELLQLAFDVLSSQHQARAVKDNANNVTTSPTTDEIITEADKMNKFISEAGLRH